MARDWWRIRKSGRQDPSANALTTATSQGRVGPSASQSPINTSLSSAWRWSHDLRDASGPGWCHIRMVNFYHIDDDMEEAAFVISMDQEEQNFELDKDEAAIIIDSGADAPIFPASMIRCGRDQDGKLVAFQDAQGNHIPVFGPKSVSVLLGANGGAEIELRDILVRSDEITWRPRCSTEHPCREQVPKKLDVRFF